MKKLKRLLVIALALFLVVTVLRFTGCGFIYSLFVKDVEMTADTIPVATGDEPYADDSWVVYWYHCGSDLESNYGAASGDLEEMLAVQLPDNVRVLIQTGGARTWHNTQVDADKLQRYLYDSKGLHLVDEQPDACMGDGDTLADFLSFCNVHYPAAHRMVVFWNHGGGSLGGAEYDQKHFYESLSLDEMYEAFQSAFTLDVNNPPLDIIGFDTCLMATIDTAYTLCDAARYLVASEESEPGCGWYYTGWLQALADDPGMDPADLGAVICDAFAEGCEKEDVADEITLSVTDLSRIGPLMNAYEALGQDALLSAVANPSFFPILGRMADRAENYGGNTDSSGYTNMVDLGDLARQCGNLLPDSSKAVQDALADCVVYKINGPYRTEATGLSCYYSYDGDKDSFETYADISTSQAFTWLYGYELEGEMDQGGLDYLNSIGYSGSVPQVRTFDTAGGGDYQLYVDSDGSAVLDVGRETADMLKGVYFMLSYIDENSDVVYALGRDNDLFMDWDNGVFRDNFRDTWYALDGHLAYMEIVYEGDGYNTYSVPILLNGEEYHLRVVYDFDSGEYNILGARQGLADNGMADKNLRQIQKGDEITMLHYAATFSGDDRFELFDSDRFTAGDSLSFGEVLMGDGEYAMFFEMVDTRNKSMWSNFALFTVEDGRIHTET